MPTIPRLWLACLAALLVLLLAGKAHAVALPEPAGLVVDAAGALDAAQRERLQARLQALQASGRAQVAVLVVPDTQALALEDFSLQVAQHWQLGHAGRDDGLLIVLVPPRQAVRIEVGYGLEGAIPDVQALRWIDEALPLLQGGRAGAVLDLLLDRIDAALPAAAAEPARDHLLDRHPEWKLPFVVAVFSPFALFPLFFGRWGVLASAPLFAAAGAWAAWLMWPTQVAAASAGTLCFVLPVLWSLNARTRDPLPGFLHAARNVGNAAAVALMFGWLMLFIGVALSGIEEAAWGAPLFAGTMALGLAAVLFPGRPARAIGIVLRSVMHLLFVLALAYPTLLAIVPHPTATAFAVAGAFTALVALSLYLEPRHKRGSLWLIGLALLLVLPVGLLMMLQAVLGSDFSTQLTQAAAGGGSVAGVLWWAARHGFFAALKLGLGGRFGGGGAQGRG